MRLLHSYKYITTPTRTLGDEQQRRRKEGERDAVVAAHNAHQTRALRNISDRISIHRCRTTRLHRSGTEGGEPSLRNRRGSRKGKELDGQTFGRLNRGASGRPRWRLGLAVGSFCFCRVNARRPTSETPNAIRSDQLQRFSLAAGVFPWPFWSLGGFLELSPAGPGGLLPGKA